MNEMTIIRRTHGTSAYQHRRDHGPLLMRMMVPSGTFYVRYSVLLLLGIEPGNDKGISFRRSADGKRLYITADEHPEAWRMQKTERVWDSLKFRSKELMAVFSDHFGIDMKQRTHYFNISEKAAAGLREITYEK